VDRLKRYFPIPYLIVASIVIGLIARDTVRSGEAALGSSGALIAVGAELPELELFDGQGQPVTPTDGKYALYMFVRGAWCPLCMAQVQEIADQYRALEQRGVEVFLIARQPEANTRALAKRFDVPIRFCVDQDGQLARTLGIEHVGGTPFLMDALGYDADSVLPTVLITDPNRTIIFADMTDNYRVRPEPSTFLAALDAHAQKTTG